MAETAPPPEGGIFFAEFGPPDAPAVVLLHGLGSDHRAWLPLVHEVAGEYRLVAPDLPGHGRSPGLSPGPALVRAVAAAVLTGMDAAGVPMAILAGTGLGAAVAVEVAAADRGRVAGLVLLDLPTGADEATAGDEAALMRRRGAREPGRRKAAGIADPFLAGALRERYRRMDVEGFVAGAEALAGWRLPPPETLAGVPALVTSGGRDPGLAEIEAFAAALDRARLAVVRDVKGPVLETTPQAVVTEVARFLRLVERGEDVAGRVLI